MTVVIQPRPEIEERFKAAARDKGIEPVALFELLVEENLPNVVSQSSGASDLLQSLENRLSAPLTDPDEIVLAEAELRQFMRDMNANRNASGERVLYPDAESV